MKKYIALFTAAVIAAALTGCTSDNRNSDSAATGGNLDAAPAGSADTVRPTDDNGEMGIFGGEDISDSEEINDEIAIYDTSADDDSAADGEEVTDDDDEGAASDGETVQIPNPLIEYDALADAEAAAGFDFAVPDEIDGNVPTSYIVINGSGIIEVIYGDNTISLRKAAGSGDISGDYNSYTEVGAGVDDISVTLRENDEKVISAIWENDGYTYALYSADGISENTATTAIAAAK